MTTTQRITLKEARQDCNWSKQELSERSGISVAAIQSIENGSLYKTHEGVAAALADALDLKVSDIAWPRGTSNRGRPPHTGRPIGKTVHRYTTTITIADGTIITIVEERTTTRCCPKCHIELPLTGICDDHG